MKNLQDYDFEKLNDAVKLSRQSKDKMKYVILNATTDRKFLHPKILVSFLTIAAIGICCMLVFTQNVNLKFSQGEITDYETPETLAEVRLANNMFTIEWHTDSMDRGNHDLQSDFHGDLVVSGDIHPIKRGDILFYNVNEQELIGRVIGLPGETVEIKEGQVYINGKKLKTFYGVATSKGFTRDEYFEKVDKSNFNVNTMEDFFNTSFNPVLVEENSIFVLVDTWWRGSDSRDLGLISFEQLKGKILGYKESLD